MIAPRPVDRFHKPDGFAYDRMTAMSLGYCARCGGVPALVAREDVAEYAISALCPGCWDQVMAAWEDDDDDVA